MTIYIWIVVQQMYVSLTYPFKIAQHTLSHIVEDCKLGIMPPPPPCQILLSGDICSAFQN